MCAQVSDITITTANLAYVHSHEFSDSIPLYAGPYKAVCTPVNPIDKCQMDFGDVQLKGNMTVDLGLSFQIKAPLKKGDTLDVTLAGFTANTANTLDVKVTAFIIPPPSYSISPYKDIGCYQTLLNGKL
jgi:hypothetical protein